MWGLRFRPARFVDEIHRRNLDHCEDDVVSALLAMGVLLLDEVSMLDDEFWEGIENVLKSLRPARRTPTGSTPEQLRRTPDKLGNLHVLLFGDFKQLPPATSRPPFIVAPSAHLNFRFVVLRQNRRVVQSDGSREDELENFHGVLTDISLCKATPRVEEFLVQAYGKGAGASAKAVDFEGSTAVFTKRRYRDAWNRPIVKRLSKMSGRSLKIQARCRATYAKEQRWFSERQTLRIRGKVRTQAPWTLHLAGHWHRDSIPTGGKKHLMRIMLTSNVDIPQRFVNGAQGRLLYWHPGHVQGRKPLLSSHPELLARFVKEGAYSSQVELIPEVHFMDIPVRRELRMK